MQTRCYSSTNDMKRSQPMRSISTRHFQPPGAKDSNETHYDVPLRVQRPHDHGKSFALPSSFGYLHAFLAKRQQEQEEQLIQLTDSKQFFAPFHEPTTTVATPRAETVAATDQTPKCVIQRSKRNSITPMTNPSLREQTTQSAAETDPANDPTASGTDDDPFASPLHHAPSPRINIGITLDSRLRKTPVLDMLRSTTMESPRSSTQTSPRRQTPLSIARF